MDLALNNLQRLICHKTKPNLTGTTTSGQSRVRSNDSEKEHHTPQSSNTEA